jgi:polar amino acid transport system substrate-binding protein
MRPFPIVLSLVTLLAGLSPRAVGQDGATVSAEEYEGWRQYNVQCARCHGQDALPNPVAANLLVSLAPDGPMADKAAFTKVVTDGRVSKGMPAFNKIVTPEQVDAIYAYLIGRAGKKIPAGRPKDPKGS